MLRLLRVSLGKVARRRRVRQRDPIIVRRDVARVWRFSNVRACACACVGPNDFHFFAAKKVIQRGRAHMCIWRNGFSFFEKLKVEIKCVCARVWRACVRVPLGLLQNDAACVYWAGVQFSDFKMRFSSSRDLMRKVEIRLL